MALSYELRTPPVLHSADPLANGSPKHSHQPLGAVQQGVSFGYCVAAAATLGDLPNTDLPARAIFLPARLHDTQTRITFTALT